MKIATNLNQAQLRHDVVLAGGAAGPPGGNVNMGGMGAAASGAGASTSSGAAPAAASSLPGSFLHQHHQESLSAALEYSPAQLALYYIAWILVASLFASCFAFCAVVTVKRGVRAIFDPLRGSYTLEDYESEVVDLHDGGKAGASEFDRQQQLAFDSAKFGSDLREGRDREKSGRISTATNKKSLNESAFTDFSQKMDSAAELLKSQQED